MSGAISVTAAVVAIGTAVATEGATFAVIAAVGATIGAVGAITHVKELQYAGAAIGAVGLVGGLASAAGMFGEVAGSAAGAGGSFGPTGAGELGLANGGSQAASAATDTASWAGSAAGEAGAAAPTAGYDNIGALIQGQGLDAATAAQAGPQDVIGMVNGQVPTGTTDVAAASAPDVNPQVAVGQDVAPLAQDAAPAAVGVEAPPAPQVTGEVKVPGVTDQPRGMLDMANAPRDPFGNVVAQGGDQGGTLGSFDNPAAPGGAGTGNPQPTIVTGKAAPSGIAGADAATPASGQVNGVASVNPMDAGIPGSFDKYAAAAGLNGPAKMGAGGSTWDAVWQFTQKNPMMAFGAMQAAGSFLSGSMSPLPQAQVEELNARAQQNQAAANLYNQQQALLQQRLSNMNQPIPTASRTPQGLINSGVTGRVA